ncbi:MAG: metallophosphoesterase [candidate division Zixibacteria bacterium]|nr:metallophosphoesterase [candidate division Zixibacteria bacterium]
MKILHTADIHLKGYEDERWKVLQKLIEIGKKEKIEIFVISGDLFDKGIDAENLRPKIREVFSNTGFKIILIPGNHDSDSYTKGMYFGEDTEILTDLHNPFLYKDVRIWGIPFEPAKAEDILRKLQSLADKLTTDKKDILLYHGELLDAFFSRHDFGEEGEERYMPVKTSYFKDLSIDYVLAGHFHSRFEVWELDSGKYFVYPGSPISITKRETGQRKVNIFEIGKPPKEYLLDTPHFEEVVIEFDPFEDVNPIEVVRRRFERLQAEATAILTVKGFVNGAAIGASETDLVRQIEQIAADRCVDKRWDCEFKDIGLILEDDLFKNFIRKLEQTDCEEEKKKQMRHMAIQAMMQARS